jgi:hypothetical protein
MFHLISCILTGVTHLVLSRLGGVARTRIWMVCSFPTGCLQRFSRASWRCPSYQYSLLHCGHVIALGSCPGAVVSNLRCLRRVGRPCPNGPNRFAPVGSVLHPFDPEHLIRRDLRQQRSKYQSGVSTPVPRAQSCCRKSLARSLALVVRSFGSCW